MEQTKTRGKQLQYIMVRLDTLSDERIERLLEVLHYSGFYGYCRIIQTIYQRRSRSITLRGLLRTNVDGCSKRTLRRIVEEFGLFLVGDDGTVRSAIDYLEPITHEADDEQMTSKTQSAHAPTCARVLRIETETEDDYHHHKDEGGDDAIAEKYIRTLSLNSEATQAAVMRCGFSRLLTAHWDEALEEFRRHAKANDTLRTIRTPGDAQRYFTHYITNVTSGAILQKYLQDIDANSHQAPDAGTFEAMPTVLSRRTPNGWEPVWES